MSEMVERVAAAMATSIYGKPPESEDGWFIKGIVDIRDLARTAVGAMRKPTDAMVQAGTIGWDAMDGSGIKPIFDPTKPYEAMISEALK